MVTKPLREFKDNKVKGYVHWDVEEWIFIRDEAKRRNIPTHWVIKELRNFATSSDALRKEFQNHLDKKFTNVVFDELRCVACGFRAKNEKGIEIHRKNKLCRLPPLEVLAR